MRGERCFRASAPVRLDFAGGWTDVAPFATAERGVVVNAAIELRAHAEIQLGGDRHLVASLDLAKQAELVDGTWQPGEIGELALHQAALRRCGLGPAALRTRSDVPPGSGLGSSGALGTALVAVTDAAGDLQRTPAELAEAAFQLEAVEAALPGGKQDQYAASLGGFHRFGFDHGEVEIDPLQLDAAFAAALEQNIVVCYTGTSRVSSNTISRVMGAYAAGQGDVVHALHSMVEVAERIAEALRASDLGAVGRLLSANWQCQQRLDSGMRTETMGRLEQRMSGLGLLGGKAAGAGAGGSMFFLAKDSASALRASQAARETGARPIPFRWAARGAELESA